ncbi:flavodoxin domain-containing protein [Streptomyces sp. NPDC046939]|uniref:flavodoxin domain-containing protein n=1 Tax=Streptomyces sp. NPDC046939 TaxID=3155376 RepID=UPI0034071737
MLHGTGHVAEMLLVDDVVDVQAYDAVVLGSPLYESRWLKAAHRFAKTEGAALRQRPLWLFSSGPLDDSASKSAIPPVPTVHQLMIRLNGREHITFGGCLRPGSGNWLADRYLRPEHYGDFRDFEQISAWSRQVGSRIRRPKRRGLLSRRQGAPKGP